MIGKRAPAEMGFYFYTYYINPKITLHWRECSFCNNGQGLQANLLGKATGRWRGGYPSYEAARKAALEIAEELNIEPVNCKRCRPDVRRTKVKVYDEKIE